MNVLQARRASSHKSFKELNLKTNWIQYYAAKLAAGRGINAKEFAAMMVDCLCPMFESVVSKTESSDDNDMNEVRVSVHQFLDQSNAFISDLPHIVPAFTKEEDQV